MTLLAYMYLVPMCRPSSDGLADRATPMDPLCRMPSLNARLRQKKSETHLEERFSGANATLGRLVNGLRRYQEEVAMNTVTSPDNLSCRE